MTITDQDALLARALLERGAMDSASLQELGRMSEASGASFVELLRRSGRLAEPELQAALHASGLALGQAISAADQPTARLDPALLPSSASAADPTRIGPYRIVEELGRGGMGIVYRAIHEALQRPCALKVIKDSLERPAEHRQRFLHEARTAARLDGHKNIVSILDSGETPQGLMYLAMELVDGAPFDQLLDQGRVKLRAGVRVVADIARALAYAHDAGVIHRDIKPQNILIDKASTARLTDFGLASRDDGHDLTRTGAMVGTVHYMSPEQANDARSADVRSDVYSMGATLYAVLTGRPPHTGVTAANVLVAIMSKAPEAPSALNPEVDPALEAICLKALAKDPADRYPDAAALARALDAWRAGDAPGPAAPRRKPPALIFGLAALLALLGLGALAWRAPWSSEPTGDAAKAAPSHPPAGAPSVRPAKLPATAPAIAVTGLNLEPGQTLAAGAFTVEGRVSPADAWVFIGERGVAARDGVFALEAELDADDEGLAIRVSRDGALKTAELAELIPIKVDALAPVLRVSDPVPRGAAGARSLVLTCRLEDASPSRLFYRGRAQEPGADGRFEVVIASSHFREPIVLEARDSVGNRAELEVCGPFPAIQFRQLWAAASQTELGRRAARRQRQLAEHIAELLGDGFEVKSPGLYGSAPRYRIPRYLHKRSGILFHLIPGGSFTMGKESEEDAAPARSIRVPAFLMAEAEVTRGQWRALDPELGGELDLPIHDVSWRAIKAWLGRAGDGLRLPSEAEWEYAARAGTSTDYFWGDEPNDRYFWHRENSKKRPRPPLRSDDRRNPFGLIDTLGNVSEFCEDDWFSNYQGGPFDRRPRRFSSPPSDREQDERAVRGGSVRRRPDKCFVWSRDGRDHDQGKEFVGFRPAVSIPWDREGRR